MSKKKEKGKVRDQFGFCRLTGKPGRFVKSHIIPQALTIGAEGGQPLFQYGDAGGRSRKWSSWYDQSLVTRDGEDILAALDTWAIAALRSQRLVWSGWGEDVTLKRELHEEVSGAFGVRTVHLDTERLRLFLLSLLWRAAASRMREFEEIQIPKAHMEVLRLTLLGGVSPDLDFYPAQLTQVSTLGHLHNHTPIRTFKFIPDLQGEDGEGVNVPFFRFYFDGLIVHFAVPGSDFPAVSELGNLIVGASSAVVLSTITYEASLQKRNFEEIVLGSIGEASEVDGLSAEGRAGSSSSVQA